MRNKHSKSINILLMLIMLLPFQVAVSKDKINSTPNWILIDESPLLERSSKYLYKGMSDRGLRYARKALQRKLSPLGEQLAHHNLCLGYLSQGETGKATAHCEQTQATVFEDLYLTQVEPGLYRITRYRSAGAELYPLNRLIAGNMEMNGISAKNNRLVKITTDH